MEEILLAHGSALFQVYVLERQLQTADIQLEAVKLWKVTLGGVQYSTRTRCIIQEFDSEQ